MIRGGIMSIRPIDMQVIIPKTSEVSSQHHGEAHRGEVEQQQFVQQMERQITQNQQQVQNPNKPEYLVNKDSRSKNEYQKNKSKKQNHKKKQEKKEGLSNSSRIDIRI